jgi:hypothetical protein
MEQGAFYTKLAIPNDKAIIPGQSYPIDDKMILWLIKWLT